MLTAVRHWLSFDMRIRTRLLLLIGLFAAAVLTNILALVFLARSMSASLDDIERVRVRQLLAAQMNERLRNAESSLSRYYSEGASGYAAAFDFQLASFGQSVETYQGTALTDEERSWAKELALIRQDVRELGQNLIRVHDQQTADLQKLIAAQAQLSNLLAALKALRPGEGEYQAALDGMNESAQRMLLTVTAYLTMPDERTRAQFMESSQHFLDNAAQFRRVTANAAPSGKTAQLDSAFDDLRDLGLQLISDRDYQLAWFTPFSADVFQGSQLVIAGEIQPLEAQRLSEAKRNLEAAVGAAIFAGLGLPLALTVLAAIMVWQLARQMDQNMLMLLRGADRVAAGQLNEKIEVTSRDELMRLADAFNHMMTDLAAREQGLTARLAELETLRQVSLQITSTLDLDQVLNLIASSVLNLVDASHVHIYTQENRAGDLRLVAGAGQHHTPPSPIHARPDSLAALAAASGQPQILNRSDGSTEAADAHSSSLAAFPLKQGEPVLGVLHITSEARASFSSEDVRILSLLADQAAVALGNARLYRDVAEREERVRALMQKLAHIQDEERHLIGLDLHDGLTQLVISAHMHLNTLNAMLAGLNDEAARRELETSRMLVKRAIEEARRVIVELRPPMVADFGLAEGLRQYVNDVSVAEGWQSETQIALDGVALNPAAEAAVFRIAQEAIANARKHSGSPRVRVALKADQDELLLSVQDWGRGFDLAALSDEGDHLGLVSMSERAKMLGGQCAISTTPGRGTTVSVRVPLAALQ